GVQLELYGLAAIDAWRADPARLRTTYCYLQAGAQPDLVTLDWDPATVGTVRARLASVLDELARPRFGATPGSWFARCDFRSFCAPGRSWLEANAPPPS